MESERKTACAWNFAKQDYPLLQGAFLLLAVSVIVANMLADIVYTYLDPRVKAN